MTDEDEDHLWKHHVGAALQHHSRFSELEVPVLSEPLPRSMVEKWVVPFYMYRSRGHAVRFADALRPLVHELDDQLITLLLSDFNWRPRIVAAYFAAITDRCTHDQHIGKLLLRSDVCYAGRGYCLALARFNTVASVTYLTAYLDYYLMHPELQFDQGFAMAALAHLDAVNQTDVVAQFKPKWLTYVADGSASSLDSLKDMFANEMQVIDAIAELVR